MSSSAVSLRRVGRQTGSYDPAPSLAESLDRWRQIVRYHTPEQLLRRAWHRLRDGISLPTPLNLGQADVLVRGRLLRRSPTVPSSVSRWREEELRFGRITLLNRTIDVGRPIRWTRDEREPVNPLWEFHLQYHEFLRELGRDDSARRIASEVVASWLRRFANVRDRVAWHPYCISRRTPVWASLILTNGLDRAVRDGAVQSLTAQISWLAKRLERDIGGNHLWENAQALLCAGCVLAGRTADRWRRLGRCLLDDCIQRQLLPWGEHYERSPMYQADLARGLSDVANWMEPIDSPCANRWREVAGRMSAFLDSIRHPDGGIPLFGDSTLDTREAVGMGPSVGESSSAWRGDYYVHGEGAHRLIFDAGNLCPDELPAHAHADLLTYEASAYGRRFIVDSGVYSYTGPNRNEFRRTRAHNVLVVDGEPLADVWSSFRMGRRGHVVRRASGTTDGGYWVSASHDAYAHIGVPFVHRAWFLPAGGPWFCIDVIETDDERDHGLESIVHLAPGLRVERGSAGRSFHVRGLEGPVLFESTSSDVVTRETRYSDRFHTSSFNETLIAHSRCHGMSCVAWSLSFSEEGRRPDAAIEGDWIRLSWEEREGARVVRIPVWAAGRMGS